MAVKKQKRQIKTLNKGRMTLDELKAYRVAYGQELGPKDYIRYIGIPALVLGGYSWLLLWNVWVTLICVLVGGIYGARYVLPNMVKRQYESIAFMQRNKFLNNMTQAMTDDGQTVQSALQKITPRSDGEFKDDLERYHAMLIGVDDERLRDSTRWFSAKYQGDVIFEQYLEQLETVLVEGKTNIDTLKDIKRYHNDIKTKQSLYATSKLGHMKDMRQMLFISAFLIAVLSISFGFSVFKEAFANHLVGYITSGVYLVVVSYFLSRFMKFTMDDSVMDIGK